ncbi:MAG: DUF1343 domain-containing protein [Anaerolineae bacterium]|nr:DUF1343 domain-containing protein [Anaerolineae bacterium]MDW8173518.1 DUF1343 domain-containing protein [Anaerolineae bacterium]
MPTTLYGIDLLQRDSLQPLRGLRVGVLTHLAANDSRLRTTHSLFARQAGEKFGCQVAAFFAPEHGLIGSEADGIHIATQPDPLSGLPVYSLYGEAQRPSPDMLMGLDALVCDLVDIGVRYYTFLWTLSHAIEAAGEVGLLVYVLDRPNPLGGRMVAGGGLDAGVSSLVGRYTIPILHGMTIGEAALYLNERHNPTPAQLYIVPCAHWRRDMTHDQTGQPWIPPSPNMPNWLTALHYGGSCLLEGTNLSEGRGTALPFQIVGAPFINDPYRLADVLNAQDWPGVGFRPVFFRPTASKHAQQVCGGVQAHITDAARFQPLAVWLGVLAILARAHGERIVWNAHFDRLAGGPRLRLVLESGEPLRPLLDEWQDYAANFAQARQPYLRYD